MKKHLFWGVMLALTAMFLLSCNKNRFDFDNLESVEGSGQWKLPIGSAHTTLGAVLNQLGENQLVSYDGDGNLQVAYKFKLDNLIKGSNFLSLGTLNFHTELEFPNPYPGEYLPEPINDTLFFNSVLELHGDSTAIESAVIKTGTLILTFQNNLTNVSRIDVSSNDITMLNGDTLFVTASSGENSLSVDLSGASFRLHDINGEVDSTLTLNYAIFYQFIGSDDPMYQVNTIIGIQNFELAELSGYIDAFEYEFAMDTTFSLPLDNIDGELSLVGTKVSISEKNSFKDFHAKLLVDYADIYDSHNPTHSSSLFQCPFLIDIVPAYTYQNIMDEETINLSMNTDFDAFRFKGSIGFQSDENNGLVVVYDTSSIGLAVEAVVPMRFNIPSVTYIDTLDLSMDDISAPEFVEKIVLGILFDSEMPFNLKAQFYTLNSMTGQVTGTLLDDELIINGSFDGQPVPSEASISVTHERLKQLLEADKLIMHFGIDTDNQDVFLNLDNGLGVTLKADVFYGGSLDFNNL